MSLHPEPDDARPQARPPRDMALYERWIDEGIADADLRGAAVDHLTARRLAIWLAARPQQRDFAHGLDQFTRTGAISRELRMHLRTRARSANYPHRTEAYRLVQYAASRGPDLGPLHPGFARACDQMDQADAMLAGLRDRARNGTAQPQPATPETSPKITVQARHNSATVTLTLDAATARLAMHAIAASADDRHAHAREVDQIGRGLPEGSYGRQNREAIAARERHAAQRLRAIEQAYLRAISHDAAFTWDPATAIRPAGNAADREIEPG